MVRKAGVSIRSSDTVNTTDRTETDNFDLDSHSFRLTLAYKFHRGGDVVEEVSYKDMYLLHQAIQQPYK